MSSKTGLIFKSSNFGDSVDRAIKKNNGEWTYFASDIAYHHNKVERGFEEIINIWGADHAGYIKRVEASIKALGNKEITAQFSSVAGLITFISCLLFGATHFPSM